MKYQSSTAQHQHAGAANELLRQDYTAEAGLQDFARTHTSPSTNTSPTSKAIITKSSRRRIYDIVINPGAYTHSSIAILTR